MSVEQTSNEETSFVSNEPNLLNTVKLVSQLYKQVEGLSEQEFLNTAVSLPVPLLHELLLSFRVVIEHSFDDGKEVWDEAFASAIGVFPSEKEEPAYLQ